MGHRALANNTTGSSNVAIGYHGGLNLTTGSNNIDIGSPGVAAESGVIRIGTVTGTTSTQKATYIAGIYGVAPSGGGTAVFINSHGQLGTVSSSRRFKTAIASIGSGSGRLGQLRPVSFRYKADPDGTLRYGLIAEEVAQVYPELVVRDAEGRIDGVRYDELAPMLLNEMQKQQAQIAQQSLRLTELDGLKQQVAELLKANQAMQAAIAKMQGKDPLVAIR